MIFIIQQFLWRQIRSFCFQIYYFHILYCLFSLRAPAFILFISVATIRWFISPCCRSTCDTATQAEKSSGRKHLLLFQRRPRASHMSAPGMRSTITLTVRHCWTFSYQMSFICRMCCRPRWWRWAVFDSQWLPRNRRKRRREPVKKRLKKVRCLSFPAEMLNILLK